MAFYLTLLFVAFFFYKYDFTNQEILFTAQTTYDGIESYKSFDNFLFLAKLPLISCLYRCIFSDKCSIVFYDESHSCFLIETNNSNGNKRKEYILYLKKNNALIFDETTESNYDKYSKDSTTGHYLEKSMMEELTEDINNKTEKEIQYKCTNNKCICLDSSKIYSESRSECIKCRDGWKKYKNTCYLETTLLLNWTDYYFHCKSLNSSLVILDDREKFEYYQQIAIKLSSITGFLRTWVGAVYNSTYEHKWLNGLSMDISFFSSVNYNNYNNCVAFFTIPNCMLQTLLCWTRSHGICEYQL